jgi:hypothetical protein
VARTCHVYTCASDLHVLHMPIVVAASKESSGPRTDAAKPAITSDRSVALNISLCLSASAGERQRRVARRIGGACLNVVSCTSGTRSEVIIGVLKRFIRTADLTIACRI